MKFRNWNTTLGWLLMLLVSSCVEPYSPKVLEAPNSYLVVNGFINTDGPTTIQLLRTQNLTDDTLPPAEEGATVKIEAENGESYRLTDTGNGIYFISGLSLNPAIKYRLYIRTLNSKEYTSEFIEVKQTPAIDNLSWDYKDDEVNIYVSTHDPAKNTKYYRWEFEETWHYKSAFYTNLKYENGQVEFRDDDDEPINDCWRSEGSNTIELSNSVRLNQDVISNYKILTIPYNAERIAVKYSILVKQYALTREAYDYWETLKKNTEGIGTLFDPLPSQLSSNIRCISDPQEPVIGFLSASSVQEKRLFIAREQLPREWKTYVPTCYADTMYLSRHNVVDYFKSGSIMPVDGIYVGSSPFPVGYSYAFKSCVDCRTRGTNVKPDFWE